MPSRNRVKLYGEDMFYHVYNRGVNKMQIFYDEEDYGVFLNLLKRYLSKEPVKDKKGREYRSLYGELELLAFCLMPNHFHLLVFQHDAVAMTQLLRGVCVSYGTYFNKKYQRQGPVFQERYKASMIMHEGYLQHISRYIHLNPMDIQGYKANYLHYPYSSVGYYLGRQSGTWVRPGRIHSVADKEKYQAFLADYEDAHEMLNVIKGELATDEE
jgi:putative transposase